MLHALPLGRLLVSAGLVTQEKLDEVLAVQKTDTRRLGELLVERGLVRAHTLAQVLSQQLSCPWVSLQRIDVSPIMIDLVPREIAVAHHMIPVHLRAGKGMPATLYVATDDPTDDVALAECARAVGARVKPMVALTSEVREALGRFYGSEDGGAHADLVEPPPMGPSDGREAARRKAPRPRLNAVAGIELVDAPPSEKPRPRVAKVLVLSAPPKFLAQVRAATATVTAEIVEGELLLAADLVKEHQPCAIVVTDDVYAFERSGLSRLALESDALLVVWSDDVEGRQIAPLLEGAVKRWRRSSYEKGAIIEGRYELLRDLGGRLPGSRWEVRHVRTGRKSVLKIGLRTPGDETDALAVRREELALARVHHPGAVDLRDAGRTDLGDPYVVIEALEGRTLEGLVVARGALPPSEASAIVRQVAELLAAAHVAGVTHEAVRAENVLLVRDGYGVERARLVDWEAATKVDGKVSPANDLAGLIGCLFQAVSGRARTESDDVREAPLGEVLTGTYDSLPALIAALDRVTPAARAGSHVLDSKREHRSTPAARPRPPVPEPALEPTPATREQRRHPRAPYRTPVRLEVAGLGAIDGRTEDISVAGLFVVTKGKLAEGTHVVVRFALPIDGKVVAESGVVKWSRGKTDALAVGIEIEAPGAESLKQIERYVSFMATDTDTKP